MRVHVEQKLNCPICNSGMRLQKHEWVFRCSSCGLLGSTLEPNIPSVPSDTGVDELKRAEGLDAVRPRNNGLILDKLRELSGNRTISILDVGCGQGQFLTEAKRRNYLIVGVEPDANVAPRTTKATGCEVFAGYFPEAVPSDRKFDAIVFNDVLEHIPSAVSTLRGSADRLHPGGILVLNCPDQRGVFYRLSNILDTFGISSPFNRMWQKGLPSPHVWYFKADHLSKLGSNVGLVEIDRMPLLPLARQGLRHRIDHVRGQSPLLNFAALGLVHLIYPALPYLPYDNWVVFLQKPKLV